MASQSLTDCDDSGVGTENKWYFYRWNEDGTM